MTEKEFKALIVKAREAMRSGSMNKARYWVGKIRKLATKEQVERSISLLNRD